MEKNHIPCVRKTSALIPYANNSRTHSDDQINQIAASMKEFGVTNPILIDGDGCIIAGHGRVMAAKKLGISELPCIELVGLNEAQKKAYVIADNQLALGGDWDDELLRIEIADIADNFDLDILGFSSEFIADLFDETKGITVESEIDDDELSEVIVQFLPCDRIDILNEINEVIQNFKEASIRVIDEQI